MVEATLSQAEPHKTSSRNGTRKTFTICPTPWLTPKSLHAAVNEQAVIATAVAAGASILLVCCLLLGFVLLQRRKRSTPLMLEHQVQKDATEMVAAT